MLGYVGSISAPDEATLKEEAHVLQCTTAGLDNALPTDILRAGSVCGLGSDLCGGIRIISLAGRFRTAAWSGTVANGLANIQAAREHDGASVHAHTPEWEERFLKTSMACCEYVRLIYRAGKIADSLGGRTQKAATNSFTL